MHYLHGTEKLPLTLDADDLHMISWSIDGAFRVHWDMKSQTRGAMTLRKGMIYGTSQKQCFNTQSSTEGELVHCGQQYGTNYVDPLLFLMPKDST